MTVLIDYTKGFFETTEGDTVGTNPATIGDVNFADVELLLHGDGTSGSTTITDSSLNAVIVTANGNAQIDTAVKKFGTGSIEFDGTGDYATVNNTSALNFGSGEWTVECWFYRTGGGNRVSQVVYNQSVVGASSDSAIYLGAGSDGMSLYLSTSGSAWTDFIVTSVAPTINTWVHCVWQRRGNTLEIYLNGSLQTVTGGSSSFTGTIYNSSRSVEIGSQSSGSYLTGYIDDLRVTKGLARYTSNFTAPTAAFLDAGPTLDLSTGSVFTHTPSANVAYTFTNPAASGTSSSFTLKVTPSATITVTWPSSVIWSGGITPTAPANGETDVYTFYTDDGGTTYYGFVSGDALA